MIIMCLNKCLLITCYLHYCIQGVCEFMLTVVITMLLKLICATHKPFTTKSMKHYTKKTQVQPVDYTCLANLLHTNYI